MVIEPIVYSLVITSLLSGLGALFLALGEEKTELMTPYLISLSAGTIFGGVFIHLVFKMAASGYTRFTGLLILAGLAASLVLERIIHWHCHNKDHHVEAFSYVLVAGGAGSNLIGGIILWNTYSFKLSGGYLSRGSIHCSRDGAQDTKRGR